jgi:rhodanese-related sulfurtransferase
MPTRVEVDRLRELLPAGAQLVEVLPADEYEDEHLPGAVSIPIQQLDASTAALLDRSRPIVVYCWDYI